MGAWNEWKQTLHEPQSCVELCGEQVERKWLQKMNTLVGALGNGSIRAVLTPQSNKRTLIALRGKDSFKFLQGMTTKKVITIEEAADSGEFCDFAAFLSGKGRLVTDSLVMFRSASKSWFIDVPSTSIEPLMAHFKQYKMRNQITIDVEEAHKAYRIYSLIATTEANLKELSLWLLNQTSQLELNFYQDPRFPLALRLIVPSHINPKDHLPPLGDIYEDTDAEDRSMYTYLRNLSGIPEGPPQIISGTSIPFECDFDLINGIDYHKGCYLGQELVARTHYRGAVRKRLFPLVSLGSVKKLLENAKVSNADLIASLNATNLATGDHILVPHDMLEATADAANDGKKPHVDKQLKSIFDIANEFPKDGASLIPIKTDADLELALSGKPLPLPPGAAAGRISKAAGGSSWHSGMGSMRTDAWHSSPSLLFYAPPASTDDPTSGILVKGSKPWWYANYLHWREEMESKAAAQAEQDI